MKKKIVIDFVLVITSFLLGFSINNKLDSKNVEISKNTKTYDNVAIMYETAEDSGEYTVTENTTWPTKGYKYNATLSKCENGSVMSYDKTNNKINVTSNVSDKCYVYFDVYDPIKITNFTYTSRLSTELTLNVTATSEESGISKYYYSIDNGQSYAESTSASHTFTELTASTTYNVKIKLVDNGGNEKEYISTATTKELKIITFNWERYQAEEGMTWKEFIESDYNPFVEDYGEKEFWISQDGVIVSPLNGGNAYYNGILVQLNDQIISNAIYTFDIPMEPPR